MGLDVGDAAECQAMTSLDRPQLSGGVDKMGLTGTATMHEECTDSGVSAGKWR